MKRMLLVVCAALTAAFAPEAKPQRAEAYFAMGCFWCAEADMEKVPGVIEAVSGYTGGTTKDPTYKQVSSETTGHYEAVKVVYDPAKVSYAKLLGVFWRNVDPFDASGQFCDKGSSYRAAIFPANATERRQAEAAKAAIEKRLGRATVVPIVDRTAFYEAEAFHQDFARTNPIRYNYYRTRCGRDARLRAVWADTKR